MPQQINLSTPVLLAEKRYFSALAMVQTLVALAVVGGGLTVYGVQSHHAATSQLKANNADRTQELQRLRATLAPAAGGGASPLRALEQELVVAQQRLAERSATWDELNRGRFVPGQGHSARLQLVARTIPESAWVSEVLADAGRMELRGYTRDPAALNGWITRLGQSPLLAGQSLRKVRVEAVESAAAGGSGSAAAGAPAGERALWSFVLGSGVPSSAGFAEGKAP